MDERLEDRRRKICGWKTVGRGETGRQNEEEERLENSRRRRRKGWQMLGGGGEAGRQ